MKRLFNRLEADWHVLTCADYVVISRKRKAKHANTFRDMSALGKIIIGGAEALDEAHKILNQSDKDI